MNKLGKLSVSLLLVIITTCIVFLPQLMSGQNEKILLNKKIYWDYDMPDSKKITSKQVARLYCNREISIGPYVDVSWYGDNNTSLMQEKAFELFDTVFEDNELVCEHIKMKIKNGSPRYSQKSTLVKMNNQPIALNFVNVIITTVDDILEFTYEEKTKTLISLSCLSTSYYLDYEYEDMYFKESLELTIKSYYENKLEVGINEHYVINEFVKKGDKKNYYTEFGILQIQIDDKNN